MSNLPYTPFGHEIDRETIFQASEPIVVYKAVWDTSSYFRTMARSINGTEYLRGAENIEKAMYKLYGHTIFPGYHSWDDTDVMNEYLATPPYKGAVGAKFIIPEYSVVARKSWEGHTLIISSRIMFEGFL